VKRLDLERHLFAKAVGTRFGGGLPIAKQRAFLAIAKSMISRRERFVAIWKSPIHRVDGAGNFALVLGRGGCFNDWTKHENRTETEL
jgi:hypothetical protein